MRILIVHQYYLTPGQPGGSRFNELARFWAEAGHEVTVVAGSRNYATGHVPQEYRRKPVVRTTDGPVSVWRCWVPASYNKSTPGRMCGFTGFFLTSLLAGVQAQRPDVVVTTSPPLTVAVTGWVLTRLRFPRAKWVFEVRDLWPESAVSTGVLRADSALVRVLYRLERLAYRASDRINVLTPAFRDDIANRALAPLGKISMVPNGADLHRFAPAERDNDARRRLGWGDRFVVLYAGAHGRANAVHQLVDAAAALRDRSAILIACAGDGPERERCEKLARERGLDNIVFLGPVAKEEMPDLIAAADVGVAVLQANPTFKTVYPNKVFDYMACARPTLLCIDGAARALVCDEARAGVFAAPEDPAAIADRIKWLADHPAERRKLGESGRRWVASKASREVLAARYLKILEEVVTCSTRESASVRST